MLRQILETQKKQRSIVNEVDTRSAGQIMHDEIKWFLQMGLLNKDKERISCPCSSGEPRNIQWRVWWSGEQQHCSEARQWVSSAGRADAGSNGMAAFRKQCLTAETKKTERLNDEQSWNGSQGGLMFKDLQRSLTEEHSVSKGKIDEQPTRN